jgi:hypothetical protein
MALIMQLRSYEQVRLRCLKTMSGIRLSRKTTISSTLIYQSGRHSISNTQAVTANCEIGPLQLITSSNLNRAQEVRAGLLERKSKYLKSYTAGW